MKARPTLHRESMPILAPLLAGATSRDRLVASLGAAFGLALTAAICLASPMGMVKFVAPMGASAVLLFVVPASPLAQPWPVIGGNVVSALVGVAVAHLPIPTPLAIGLSIGLAILAMSLLRCLHPPGGAVALSTVIGGPAVTASGFVFPFVPVALNSILLVAAGFAFHRFSGHAYPHKVAPPLSTEPTIDAGDVEAALREAGEAFDVSPDDLLRIAKRAATHAALRRARR